MIEDWSFTEIWNNSLITLPSRPTVYRDYIYASELGNSYINRYLKMLGTKPTNPPNYRSLRKFEAGNIWEWIVGFVLERAGLLKERQMRARVELPGMLAVSGKMDFYAGGSMDFERAEHEVNKLHLPEFVDHATKDIIAQLKKSYEGKELCEAILENKSVSSFVFERCKKVKRANVNHTLQNFHYVYGANLKIGKLVYICRDDCRLMEFNIFNPSPILFEDYSKDIEAMTYYFNNKELPPKEKELIFDDAACRFSKNLAVEYSQYLTYLYKYKNPQEYRDKYAAMSASFNRTFRRCVDGANMTDLNKQVIRDAKKLFPEWDKYVVIARETGVLDIVEEIEID